MHIVIWALIPYALLSVAAEVQGDDPKPTPVMPNQDFKSWAKQVKSKAEEIEAKDGLTEDVPKKTASSSKDNKARNSNVPIRTTKEGGSLRQPTSDKIQPSGNNRFSDDAKLPTAKPSSATARGGSDSESVENQNKAANKMNEFAKDAGCLKKLLHLKMSSLTFRYNAEMDEVIALVTTVPAPKAKHLIYHMPTDLFELCADARCFGAMLSEERYIQTKRLIDPNATSISAEPNATQSTSSIKNTGNTLKTNPTAVKDFEGKGPAELSKLTQKPDVSKKITADELKGTAKKKSDGDLVTNSARNPDD